MRSNALLAGLSRTLPFDKAVSTPLDLNPWRYRALPPWAIGPVSLVRYMLIGETPHGVSAVIPLPKRPALVGLALLLASHMVPVPHARAQSPYEPASADNREVYRHEAPEEAAMLRRSRESWREGAWSSAAATCTGRARYDGDRLILAEDYGNQIFVDEVEAYDAKGLYWVIPRLHYPIRCDDLQRVTFIRVTHDEWSEVILVSWDHSYRHIHLHGLPHTGPGGDALVFAEGQYGLAVGPPPTIQIVVRDQRGHWNKIWDYLPLDAGDWAFGGWESPNRFRVTFWNGVRNRKEALFDSEVLRWDSIIEFNSTSFTRTDGPKSPEKPIP